MLLFSVKFTNFVIISDKNNWYSPYFHKNLHKKTLDLVKVTQNPPPLWINVVQSLKKPCETVKTRNEQEICNQHWIRGEGERVRALQLLSLILGVFLWYFFIHPEASVGVLEKMLFEFVEHPSISISKW